EPLVDQGERGPAVGGDAVLDLLPLLLDVHVEDEPPPLCLLVDRREIFEARRADAVDHRPEALERRAEPAGQAVPLLPVAGGGRRRGPREGRGPVPRVRWWGARRTSRRPASWAASSTNSSQAKSSRSLPWRK